MLGGPLGGPFVVLGALLGSFGGLPCAPLGSLGSFWAPLGGAFFKIPLVLVWYLEMSVLFRALGGAPGGS